MQFAYGRISMFGHIASAQSWSTGWSFAVSSAPTSAQLQSVLSAQVNPAVATAWLGSGDSQGIGDICSADTTLDGVRAYYYPAGQSKAAVQAELLYPTPAVGAASGSLPSQTSLVASLQSGLPGRSNRGRMYLPCTGAQLTGHQLVGRDVTQLATNIAVMLSNFNAMTGTPSKFTTAIAGKNGLVPVTQVRIDSEPDIQRRRADKLRAVTAGTGAVTGQ